ncbi:MAG: hypothetical protein ACJ8EB_03970 [Allosphingosinicella sp.]
MPLRLRTKIGSFEIEYEGEEAFLKSDVPNIVSQIIAVARDLPAAVPEGGSGAGANNGAGSGSLGQSTNTVASMMDAKTGPDLALAAAVHLSLVKGQDKFSRKDLLAEMQGATTFYNQNYSSNLSKILSNLTKSKRLNLVGNNTFALPRAVRDEYESKLKSDG